MPNTNKLILLLLTITGLGHGYSVFTPNCTSPEKPFNLVKSPAGRGTLDILWSSLFTIIACTWTVLHLNVPEQRSGRDPGWKGDMKWNLKGSLTKMKWMLVTMLAPELALSLAAANLMNAREQRDAVAEFAKEDGVEWTLTHSYFTGMGGFVIHFDLGPTLSSGQIEYSTPSTRSHENDAESQILKEKGHGISATSETKHGGLPQDQNLERRSWHLANISGAKSSRPQDDLTNAQNVQGTRPMRDAIFSTTTSKFWGEDTARFNNPYVLSGSQMELLRNRGYIATLPSISTDDINGRSGSDSFSKVIAMIQILWSALEAVVRRARGLSISQLELAVLAFAVCALGLYVLSWAKPKDVQIPVILSYNGLQSPVEVLKELNYKEAEETDTGWELINVFRIPGSLQTHPDSYGAARPNDSCCGTTRSTFFRGDGFASALGLLVGSTVFGSLHMIAWNFDFPTATEKVLWRIASTMCTFLPVFLFGTMMGSAFFPPIPRTLSRRTRKLLILLCWWKDYPLVWGIWSLYFAARCYLLVEIFRSLCFLPADAYISTWASNVPHVG
jgi:hypothetical protein